ncbi:ABC transporter ATP-binding protein [Rhodoligotrophos defluvii]|uniref:ABC transporter ATP-binding protein n=1 Tax=Rhodoligotrophos defluvii TaxID=2561934 RepID=UPI0010CA1BE1|nr:ABC transporter ATP-binding protein [Rhodoligotrophos defluvii]
MLELQGISKSFGSVAAVKDVSFSVAQGEFFSLLGPSGCGKTTLLRVIAGIYESDAGSIRLNGQSIDNKPMRARDTALVFQNYALFPHLSVFENVAFGLKMRRVPRAEITRRAGEALELVRMASFAKRLPGELSGGQQQRVALARSVVVQPSLLLLDEPLSNLDAKLRDEMRGEIRSLQQRLGITTILVTHDLHEAFAVSDRIAVLRQGQLQQVGTANELYDAPASRFVAGFVGHVNLLAGTVVALADGKVTIACGNGLDLSAAARNLSWQIGQPAWVSLRPERIRLGAADLDGGTFDAKVTEITYLGSRVHLALDVAGTAIRADVQNVGQALPKPGDRVRIGWSRGDVIARPEEPDHGR